MEAAAPHSEVCVVSLSDPHPDQTCATLVVGDAEVIAHRARFFEPKSAQRRYWAAQSFPTLAAASAELGEEHEGEPGGPCFLVWTSVG